MTVTQFQQMLHALYQGDVSYPTSSDNEWAHRLQLLKDAINAWDNEKGILWRELWKLRSEASDGDATILTSDLTYTTPTDFRFFGGFIRTRPSGGSFWSYYPVITPEKGDTQLSLSLNKGVFLTGNKKTGYTINFISQSTVGDTLDYPYYKEPFEPSAAADVIEMSDPYFAVYHALATLHEIDGNGDRAGLAISKAQARMNNMRVRNTLPPFLQASELSDTLYDTGTGGFGT